MKTLIIRTVILSLLLTALAILLLNPVGNVSANGIKDLQNSNSSSTSQNTAKPVRKHIKNKKHKKKRKHHPKIKT